MARYSHLIMYAMAYLTSTAVMAMQSPSFAQVQEAIKNQINPFEEHKRLRSKTFLACGENAATLCQEKPPMITMMPTPLMPFAEDPLMKLLLSPPSSQMGGSPLILEEIALLGQPDESGDDSRGSSEDEDFGFVMVSSSPVAYDPVDALVDDMMRTVLSMRMEPPPSLHITSELESIAEEEEQMEEAEGNEMDAQAFEQVFDTLVQSMLGHSAAAAEAIASSEEQQEEDLPFPLLDMYDPVALMNKLKQKGEDIIQESADSADNQENEEEEMKTRLARRLTQIDSNDNNTRRRLQMNDSTEEIIMISMIPVTTTRTTPQIQLAPPSTSRSPARATRINIGYGDSIDKCIWKYYREQPQNLTPYCAASMSDLEQVTTSLTERYHFLMGIQYSRWSNFFLLSAFLMSYIILMYFLYYLLFGEDEEEQQQEDEEEEEESCLSIVFHSIIFVAVGLVIAIISVLDPAFVVLMCAAVLLLSGVHNCLEGFCICINNCDEEEQEEHNLEQYVLVTDHDEETYNSSHYPAMTTKDRDANTTATTVTDALGDNNVAYEGVPVSMPVQAV
uniref:PRA1 family protein n=1 Tax=Helicotheca tamesis TaxID=374047 RepID=A0A7S2HFA3_9STRA|eukprot:CAMPEP_0185728688 /NCGR_PEP_ID=MMETSP1171-20130828/4042_1 /TAXON_ID=374046 /ORGANISM="Helicotheca tamensis, Strain CCMP826" /LENGTH=560 /DNA_ID=CAMNT_0028397419 /DNA_START=27 /DNA_END=1709 /DNA_ORIENTATION=-